MAASGGDKCGSWNQGWDGKLLFIMLSSAYLNKKAISMNFSVSASSSVYSHIAYNTASCIVLHNSVNVKFLLFRKQEIRATCVCRLA